ncbi:hypothetical protein NQ315_007464 [Exocentrus adspersus]|uniref:C2H2-type domain-containing protein n=1 Tax=Exocentrus adspersus TaxID=1586481 RepID=A0AAV8VIE0_9CUCU|nr:hypothetical protein NQ315_007464 [Exocentrus adspersus]
MRGNKNKKKLEICVLCCNKSLERDLEQIDEVTREVLSVLLTTVHTALFKQPVMCLNCSQRIDAVFQFKSACLYVEDFITLFVNTGERNRIDLKQIYLSERCSQELIDALRGRDLCRLCLSVAGDGFVCLDGSDFDVNYIRDMIKRCLPEVNVNNTRDSVVCKVCISCLENYCDFIENYSETEKLIEHYCGENNIDENEPITLTEVLEFTSRKNREVENLNSTNDFSENVDFTDKIEVVDSGSAVRFHVIKESSTGVTKLQNPPDSASTSSSVLSSDSKSHGCDLRNYKSNRKACSRRHTCTRKDIAEINSFKCDLCNYQTERKRSLISHAATHKDAPRTNWWDCNFCDFTAKRSSNLKTHMLTHKDPSEVELFECTLCDFKTKYKYSLAKHKSVHKPASKIKWYKCDSCDYKSKRKDNLRVHHSSMHGSASEIVWFECDSCSFKTKRKGHLNRHQLGHKDASQIKWYACDLCSFKFKHRFRLEAHMMVHKDPSERKWYKCDSCDYKFKRKYNLRVHHISMHKCKSEIDRSKCEFCNNRSNRKPR